jgi:hypothetical protein
MSRDGIFLYSISVFHSDINKNIRVVAIQDFKIADIIDAQSMLEVNR